MPVLGCLSGCGSSTLAVALAEESATAWNANAPPEKDAHDERAPRRFVARVVECAPSGRSGLAAASSAELGRHESGWVRGTRGQVLLERCANLLLDARSLPMPSAPPGIAFTVVDIALGLRQAVQAAVWLSGQLRSAEVVVMVTAVSVPGLRRLEGDLELLGHDRVVVAVAGPPLKRMRHVVASAGPRTRELIRTDLLVPIPTVGALAADGLNPRPLPPALLRCAAQILDRCRNSAPLH